MRITSGASHPFPTGRSWDHWFAFSSQEDLAGLGAARVPGLQIFVFNLANYDCFNGTELPTTPCPNPLPAYLQQVTNGPGNPDNPNVGIVDPSGQQWIAFDADGTFGGNTGAAAAHRQIFIKDLTTNEIRQVTFSGAGDSVLPSIDHEALNVVFLSNAPLTGFPTPPGVQQVFVYRRGDRVTTQVTFGQVPSTHAMTSQTIISFQSAADLLGDGHDTGITQIFWAVIDNTTHTVTLHQLTKGNAPSQRPFLSDEGQLIGFESSATNIPGTLGGPGNQIYLSTRVDAPGVVPTIQQLTTPDRFGDCSFPAVRSDTVGVRVGMICTGDPLSNGTTGNRVFVLDLHDRTLYQITGTGDVIGPIALNIGHWFVSLSDNTDLTGTGACGYQLFIVDYAVNDGKWQAATQVGQLPPDAANPNGSSLIGGRLFELLPGTGASGSELAITTTAGVSTAGIESHPADGIVLIVGAPDEVNHEASIRIQGGSNGGPNRVTIPPVPMPPGTGVAAVCIQAAGDGAGVIDCDGGRSGSDVVLLQDHNTDKSDPFCEFGCREDNASCHPGNLIGPHRTICPVCIGADPLHNPDGTCQGGPYNGQACTSDQACDAGLPCKDGTEPTCNGPLTSNVTNAFVAGGAQLTLPVTMSFSLGQGADNAYCTADDQYSPVHDLPAQLRLDTANASATILNADDVLGATLAVTETGAPFDCKRMRAGDLTGAELVGVIPLLDIPNVPPQSLHDVVVSLRLFAKPPPFDACATSPNGVLACSTNSDCDDGNPCNGTETCVNRRCLAGTPPSCDDNNASTIDSCNPQTGACVHAPCTGCNGSFDGTTCQPPTTQCNFCGGETCNISNGQCNPGPAPTCDDSNPCTDDSCDTAQNKCVHTNNTATCDDNDKCTTNDTCSGGKCVGTPVDCGPDPDNNVCTGVPTCDPADGVCKQTPLQCVGTNPCIDDSCDPVNGCQHSPNTGRACDDGSACTINDACQSGICTGTPSCDDGNPCTTDTCQADDTCDHTPIPGCRPCATAGDCNTGNPCSIDTCQANNTCLSTPIPNCCQTAADCNDSDPCTDDACVANVCAHTPNTGATCDDHNVCTTGDTCAAGVCVGTPVLVPTTCDDGNVCTTGDTCVAGKCLGTPVLVPTACDDHNACTTGDTCVAGICTGTPVVVSDGNICNGLETCDPLTGAIIPGTPVNCDDGDPCTTDACLPDGSCSHTPDPLCQLNALIADISNAPPRALGGRARRSWLKQHAKLARTKFMAGVRGGQFQPQKNARNLRSGARLLRAIIRNLQKGAASGKIDSKLAAHLAQLASGPVAQIGQLLGGGP